MVFVTAGFARMVVAATQPCLEVFSHHRALAEFRAAAAALKRPGRSATCRRRWEPIQAHGFAAKSRQDRPM